MITVKLKRGAGIPTTAQLSDYELGWSTNLKKLYINDNGTISLAAGALNLSLNGAASTNEGSFSFYAPTSVTAGKVVRIKDTVVAGEDPFTYISIDANPTDLSTNLVTSGGVKTALDNKVNIVAGYGLIADEDYEKLDAIEAGAQVNIIETVKLNGTALTVTDKTVDVNGVEIVTNKVSSWSSTTTDTNYPTEKLVKDSLDTKLTRTVTATGTTSTIENAGSEFNILNEVSAGAGVKLHLASGEAYLAKYNTGDTVVYTDGNKLLNKAEVAAMITGDASRLITARTGDLGSYVYEPFATYAALVAGPWYYQGTDVIVADLNDGDYVYVKDDENHSNKQTMYVWDGSTWTYAVSFSEEPLVADGTTLETYSDGKYIRVKNSGIGTDQLADSAVVTAKIADANVTLAKLLTTSVSGKARFVAYNNDNNPYAIKINNQVADPTDLFAPTTSGTTGQYLKAIGDSAPVWETFPTLTTVSLNGSATTSAVFYAPSLSGDAGQMLFSNGSGNSPYWGSTIDGGTWTA